MGGALRIDMGGEIYHVLNRANARMAIFELPRFRDNIGRSERSLFNKDIFLSNNA